MSHVCLSVSLSVALSTRLRFADLPEQEEGKKDEKKKWNTEKERAESREHQREGGKKERERPSAINQSGSHTVKPPSLLTSHHQKRDS